MSAQPAKKNKKKGATNLRKHLTALQQKNERLEDSVALLTQSIVKLTYAIHNLNNKNNKGHFGYIHDLIMNKIQNSLVFPKSKVKGLILSKSAGVKYDIVANEYKQNIIGTNILIPNMNPDALHTYAVTFYVFAKFAEEDEFDLVPTFQKKSGEDLNSDSDKDVDLFGYDRFTSVHFPRNFYETINANGVIDVVEL